MAKSLFDSYEEGNMEVTHDGEELTFDFPTWMQEAGPILENKEKLLEWMEKHNNTIAIIHAGLAKTKIDFCAVVRPADVPGEKKGEKIKISLFKDQEKAIERAKAFKIKPASRPGTGGKTPEERSDKALKLLNSLTPEMRAAVMAQANN